MRTEALQALRGVEHIIHAGDIGTPQVLEELRAIAPITAVRGNVDSEDWAQPFPETAAVEIGGCLFYVLHNLQCLDLVPHAAGVAAVIYGHSHAPWQNSRDGVLYFNPGSAGPRRFHLPVTVGCLQIANNRILGEIIPVLP